MVKFKKDYVKYIDEHTEFTFRKGYSYDCIPKDNGRLIFNHDRSVHVLIEEEEIEEYLEGGIC